MKKKKQCTLDKQDVLDAYWSSYPDYPVEDWKAEVANGNTRLGYWEWVHNKTKEKENVIHM